MKFGSLIPYKFAKFINVTEKKNVAFSGSSSGHLANHEMTDMVNGLKSLTGTLFKIYFVNCYIFRMLFLLELFSFPYIRKFVRPDNCLSVFRWSN